MQSLVSEISKYILILLASLYVYIGFSDFLKNKKDENVFAMPLIILLFHATGFLSIYLKLNNDKVLILYLLQVTGFLFFSLIYNIFYRQFSKALFYHMNFLLMTGFIFITRISVKAGYRQTLFAALALLASLSLPYLIKRVGFLRNMGLLYGMIGVGTLLYVFLVASRIYGAKNWITILGFRFQPSEFVKIILIFMIASFLYVSKSLKQIAIISFFSGIMVILLVLGRDLGAALLFFVTFVIMIYFATKNKVLLGIFSSGGLVAAVVGYFLFPHVRVRVTAFLDPWSNIDDKGYQITQSLFGIGSGGWFGFGLFRGSPKSTPVVESDFIFSGISEEMGLLFAILLILIYICTFLVLIFLIEKTTDEFHKNISVGCLTMYSFQAFLSIGGSIKFIPSTGVTLPLISAGGSSLISMIFIFSIIQGLYLASINTEAKKGFRSHKLAYLLLTLFASLMVYLCYFQFLVSPKIINNAYNKRLDLYESVVLRGKIYSSDGVLLAESIEKKDGKTERKYPFKDMYSHIVGRNENGKTGVEAIMNYELYTSNDDVIKRISERLSGIKNKGDTVITTLDSKLQSSLYRAIGSYSGAGVILEPETGRILALVSKPGFHPDRVKEDREKLSSEKGRASYLINRATHGLYPPGSTFKIATALSYLKEKKSDKKFSFDCKGVFRKENEELTCFNKTVHGKENLEIAFANSCNGAFAKIGLDLDKNLYKTVCEELLFNTELPFPLPTLQSSFTLDSTSNPGEVIQTAIGQGKTLVTPVHNALIASTLANKGILMKPYLVEKIRSFDGKHLVKEFRPKKYAGLIEEDKAKKLSSYMQAVVKKGTAKKLSWLGYKIYGKTGTAEYKNEKGSLDSHSWFLGFAEKKGKKIAVSFLIEGEKRGNYSATDVAYKVFSEWQ